MIRRKEARHEGLVSTALGLHSVSRQRSLHAGAVELEIRERLSCNAVIVASLYYQWRLQFPFNRYLSTCWMVQRLSSSRLVSSS